MFLRRLLPFLLFPVFSVAAWGSSDVSCSPAWTLTPGDYDRCTQLPILSPSNDRRVNLKLLLVDGGLARLKGEPLAGEDTEIGYGRVPLSLEMFEHLVVPVREQAPALDEDAQPAADAYAGRCTSNEAGKEAYIKAVGNDGKIPEAERQILIAARKGLTPVCVDAPEKEASNATPDATGIASETGAAFAVYLRGASGFYAGRYDEASFVFATLAESDDPWLKETSRYMLGRADLNRAQKNAFDEYGLADLEKVDQTALSAAEKRFMEYLKNYPAGLYASSARGLLRRVYWMSNRPQKLADECEWQIGHPDSPQHNMSLDNFAQEVDGKLLDMPGAGEIRNPLLLAVLDLALMRLESPSATHRLTLAELQKQKQRFAGREALYEFLVASHYYHVQKDPVKALEHLSGRKPAVMTYLDFSRLVLRGLALEAKRDHAVARKLWLDLLPASRQPLQAETVQLALAINYQRGKEVHLAFEPGSPITEAGIRKVLIGNTASATLLRQIVQNSANPVEERAFALFTLLYKDLFQGHYEDFVEDYKLIQKTGYSLVEKGSLWLSWSGKKTGDGLACPSTLDIAEALAKNPHDPYGLLCLGDFVKAGFGQIDPRFFGTYEKPAAAGKAVLGAGPSDFTGKTFSRGDGYKIVAADEAAAPELRAYALYRLVRCYAPAGTNECGGDDVAEPVRRSWFNTLKHDYPDSPWAKKLKYYW